MASITLKDVPEALLIRLRAAAGRDRRSLNQQAIVLLEAALDRTAPDTEQAERQVVAWRALAGMWQSDLCFEDEVDAIYAARTPGRDVDL